MKRGLVATCAASALALASAPVANAGPLIDDAVAALQSSPVYVNPQAELALNEGEARRLRTAIASSGAGPMYIAVLPLAAEAEAGGSADGVLQAIHDGIDRPGTYAVVVGRRFRAGSEGVLDPGVAGRLATEALEAHRSDGVAATLVDFVERVAAARAQGGGGGAPDDGGDPGSGGAVLIAILVVGGGGLLLYTVWRKRRQAQAELAEVKEAAHDDLIALAEDVAALEERVDTNPAAKAEYHHALTNYDEASGSYDRARSTRELEAVASALEEGRYHMTAAEAHLDGREPPARTPPCFFDPRHGPSTREVSWAPPGGVPRDVPACEADAQAVERGVEPASREVLAAGRRVPYWNAPAYFGPWASGYFMPFGGVGFLSGLFVGQLLGGAYGGFGYGAWPGAATGSGWDGGGGDGFGSDFGGGMDFGGGDLGGGGGDF